MQISINSNIGKQRKTNQDYADYFTSLAGQQLFILCDGVGGHQAGEIASELTTTYIGEAFSSLTQALVEESIQAWFKDVIQAVNQFIFNKAQTDSQLQGMGTTLIMAIQIEEAIYIAHVGDSRAYAFKGNELRQLTQDHSLVNELIRLGEITPEEGQNHPRKNIVTQSIGVTLEVNYEVTEIPLQALDCLMLCSDGLSNMLTNEQILNLYQEFTNLDKLGKALIEAANQAGGQDNITLILLADFLASSREAGVQA